MTANNRRWLVVAIAGVLLCGLAVAGVAGLLAYFSLRDNIMSEGPAPEVTFLAPREDSPDSAAEEDDATPQSQPPAGDTQQQMEVIEGQVSVLRELEATGDVTKSFMTPEDLRERVESDWLADYTPEEAQADVMLYASLDLMESDFDLYNYIADLLTEQVAGFYDTEDEEFFLISSDTVFGPLERLTYAHEYVHALQDQTYDLDSYEQEELNKVDPDASFALSALIEGDAQLATILYVQSHFTPEDISDLIDDQSDMDFPVLDAAPPILEAELLFPYVEGMTFVQTLYSEGGWDLVNEAYQNPPVSTEQILHPERYVDGDMPLAVELASTEDTLAALGSGWELVEELPLGEFYVIRHLELQLSPGRAIEAAEGWGGDRYALFRESSGDGLVFIYSIVWDEQAEADDFASAYTDFGDRRAGGSADLSQSGLACWQAEIYFCMAQDGDQTWLVRGPDEATVAAILSLYELD